MSYIIVCMGLVIFGIMCMADADKVNEECGTEEQDYYDNVEEYQWN